MDEISRILRDERALCSPKSFRRAATQRLDVAWFLLRNSEYYLDAIYLAGYAAECSLKALVLERTPKGKWAATCEEIGSGAKAHDVTFLRGILLRRGCAIPDGVEASLKHVKGNWGTKLRYIGARIPHAEAARFLDHVRSTIEWTGRST